MNKLKLNVFIGNFEAKATIDVNSHPNIQIQNLLSFLKYNSDKNDYITIYTNSIYVLNKLTVLQLYYKYNVNCDYFKHRIIECKVYEVGLDDSIKEVPNYKGTVSDDNLLNNFIENSNEEFAIIQQKSKGWIK